MAVALFATTTKDRRHGMLCVGVFLLLFWSDYAFHLQAVCHQAQQVITAGCYVCFPVLQGSAGYPKIIAKFYLRHACGNPQGFDGGLLCIIVNHWTYPASCIRCNNPRRRMIPMRSRCIQEMFRSRRFCRKSRRYTLCRRSFRCLLFR